MVGESHTFVVPAYGRSPHLQDCLASLAGQTHRSKIVVATSTPFPELEELVSRFGARLWVHGPNLGIAHDWNVALAQGGAGWVTLAHQDDVYYPQFAEQTLLAAASVSDASLVFTDYEELVDDRVRRHGPLLVLKRLLLEQAFLLRRRLSAPSAKRRCLCFGTAIPCPAVTLHTGRSSVRFSDQFKVNLDWSAWLALADEPGSFVRVRRVLMAHRIHAASATSGAIDDGVRAREDQQMLERFWPVPIARLLGRAFRLAYASNKG